MQWEGMALGHVETFKMDIRPMAADGTISIQPIGSVRSNIGEQQTGGFESVETTIEMKPEFRNYLEGLADYSHLHILYWLSEMTESHGLHRPQANPEVPVVGMFACR